MSVSSLTPVNTILSEDCITGMRALPAGHVDLVFADPPFNIGYEYDVYRDRLECENYLDWSREWISAVHHCLKPEGTFWLAIGDEYAAELKIIAQEVGFYPRSWVIWYYTFGVNCVHKFSRSHAHLFYFVKDSENFTFAGQELENRIPSARQLVYNDKRANPLGRLPDDTWIIPPADSTAGEDFLNERILSELQLRQQAVQENESTWTLRPQDVEACFQPEEDTWYFPRVAGTFKERAGFHGCQMPEQLLGRIIRCCSLEKELVLDPFSGSATTLAVAKKLGRKYLGYEISEEYVRHGMSRLESIRSGDRLDGAAEPLLSAPKTAEGLAGQKRIARTKKQEAQAEAASKKSSPPAWNDAVAREQHNARRQLELTCQGVVQAFLDSHAGYSIDRVLADPELSEKFHAACRVAGLVGDACTWNLLLFRLRKSCQLQEVKTAERTAISWTDCNPYRAASEIALQSLLNEKQTGSLDEVLCDPALTAEFDRRAVLLAPGFGSLQYRWAALKIRKQARVARGRGYVLWNVQRKTLKNRLSALMPLQEIQATELPETAGCYLLKNGKQVLYVGESDNLRRQLLTWQQQHSEIFCWFPEKTTVAFQEQPLSENGPLAWQSAIATEFQPTLNFQELLNQKS